MNEYEYLDLIVEWEEKRNLFSWKIYDMKVWEYIRFGIHHIVLTKIRNNEEKDFYYYIPENNAKKFIGVASELPKKILKHRELLVVNTPSRILIDGKYVSRFIDKMFEYCNKSYYVLEAESSDDISECITQNVIRYEPNNFAYQKVENNYVNSKCQKLISLLEKDFNISFNANEKRYIKDNIYSVVQNHKVHKNFYKILLKQIRPKVIVVVSAAEQTKRYLIEAAKEMGIITVEYDHAFTMACSTDNYYKKKHNLKSYADYKWTYGKSVIESYKLPIDSNKIRVVGNGYHNWRIENINKQKKITNKKLILVLSDYSDYASTGLAELAVDIANKVSDEYVVMFKLHPGEVDWRNKYPELRGSKVIIPLLKNHNDIYEYIYSASHIIGSMGSALSEAVELNADIYLYTKAPNSIFSENLYLNKAARKIDSADSFIKAMKDDYVCSRESLYESDPVKSLNRELDKLMK